eukprot:13218542-Alexandrium_andersonii.AAC.1
MVTTSCMWRTVVKAVPLRHMPGAHLQKTSRAAAKTCGPKCGWRGAAGRRSPSRSPRRPCRSSPHVGSRPS